MSESSYPWGGSTVGDAGPYTGDTWAQIWRYYFAPDRTDEGVMQSAENELQLTPGAGKVTLATGVAIVDGSFYLNDAALDIAVVTPAGATRFDVIALRKGWVAQTVRAVKIDGVEGGGIPAITQSDGVTWDLPLYNIKTTVGGAITTELTRFVLIGRLTANTLLPLIIALSS